MTTSHACKHGFTLVETLAAIAIITALVASMTPFVADYVQAAQRESDKRTLTVLNDALTRYKSQGGNISALTLGAPVSNILSRLQQPIKWNGLTHQVIKTGQTYPARSLDIQGNGRSLRFVRYNRYISDDLDIDGETTVVKGSNVAMGSITREVWTGITGGPISNLTSNAAYIANTPNLVETMTQISAPQNWGDNYGQRIEGYLYPRKTGVQILTLWGDDYASLYIAGSTDPQSLRLLGTAGFNSPTLYCYMEAGKAYKFRILHKEGTGSDHCLLQWREPDGTVLGINAIPSTMFSDAYDGAEANAIAVFESYPSVAHKAVGSSAAFSAALTNVSGRQWYKNGLPIAGATSSTLTVSNITQADNGASFYCVGKRDGAAITSAPSKLYVYATPTGLSNSVIEERWDGITGGSVSHLTSAAAYIANAPTSTFTRTSLGLPSNAGDNFGRRIRGYIVAPFTGNYQFRFGSDDGGEFWLSTNTSPSNSTRVINNTVGGLGYGNRTLTAGTKYYFEILHKEAASADGCTLAWYCDNGFGETAISSTFLDKYP